ncbi:signal recognition particle-docking protein FtsY [Methyloceanibacter sp.]|uniref:signal recognition particle-docking protein FtsY n=1 Tax=Methyloceanibacter sp. TaxID=1965321 RepID=UPI003D6D7A6B
MSSEKKPGFWQRLFGLDAAEPPKTEPPAPKPVKREPPASKPAQKEPPKQKQPAKTAEGAAHAKKAAKLKAPPPAMPHAAKDDSGPLGEGPKGPKPAGGKRPRKPKSKAPAAVPPPAGPATREGASQPEERAPGTREKGTPEEPDPPQPATEPQKTEDDKPSKASAQSELAPRRSWFTQLRAGLARTSNALSDNLASVLSRRKLDEETLDELEDALIKADLGVPMASRIRQALAATRHERGLSPQGLRDLLAAEIAKVLAPVAKPFVLDARAHPHVILLVGVNGTGKTTTAAKLAHYFMRAGSSVMLAAADTFRAAAIDQLKVWGARVGAEVVSRGVGADPAGVAYEALERARAEKRRVLIIDTAGRLQNKADLMAELAKIVRVLKKLDVAAPHSVVLVLDATTGQNALNQVETFQEIAGVTSLVATKLDGSARGGIVVAIAERFGLPVSAIGVGEGVDDLQPFDAEDFARAIAGLDTRNAAAA